MTNLLLILLLVVGCESPTEGDTSSNEVDIDWILLKSDISGDSGYTLLPVSPVPV